MGGHFGDPGCLDQWNSAQQWASAGLDGSGNGNGDCFGLLASGFRVTDQFMANNLLSWNGNQHSSNPAFDHAPGLGLDLNFMSRGFPGGQLASNDFLPWNNDQNWANAGLDHGTVVGNGFGTLLVSGHASAPGDDHNLAASGFRDGQLMDNDFLRWTGNQNWANPGLGNVRPSGNDFGMNPVFGHASVPGNDHSLSAPLPPGARVMKNVPWIDNKDWANSLFDNSPAVGNGHGMTPVFSHASAPSDSHGFPTPDFPDSQLIDNDFLPWSYTQQSATLLSAHAAIMESGRANLDSMSPVANVPDSMQVPFDLGGLIGNDYENDSSMDMLAPGLAENSYEHEASSNNHPGVMVPGTTQAIIHVAPPQAPSVTIACTFPDCIKTFGRDSDRIRHEAKHRRLRGAHLCPIHGCVKSTGKGYSRADKVTEHLWKKHANLGYTKA